MANVLIIIKLWSVLIQKGWLYVKGLDWHGWGPLYENKKWDADSDENSGKFSIYTITYISSDLLLMPHLDQHLCGAHSSPPCVAHTPNERSPLYASST